MSRSRAAALAGGLAALLALPAAAAGQLCWWRTSLERCEFLLLTETALSAPLLNTHATKWVRGYPGDSLPLAMDAFHPELLWEFGGLVVLDRRTAIGPTYQFGISLEQGEGTKRFGVRVRRQQAKWLALEANAGVLTGHAGTSGDRAFRATRKQGPTLEVSANLAELLQVGLRYDDLAWRDNDTLQRALYPTGRARALSGVVSVGARPSVPLNLGMAGAFVVLAVLFGRLE